MIRNLLTSILLGMIIGCGESSSPPDLDAGDDGAGGSIDPTSDAEPTTPDAGTDKCPNLDGQNCNLPEGGTCQFTRTEESSCSFDCVFQGSPRFRSMNLEQVLSAVEYCGMEL